MRAIDWAVEREVLLVNLSLWTTNRDHEQDLSEAVERARVAGTTIVTAHRDGPDRWLPGSLPGVVAVDLDWTCGRDEIRLQSLDADGACLSLSGYPRPIPGVSAERNLRGVSFAVANAAGFLARACESGTGGSPVQSLLALLERTR